MTEEQKAWVDRRMDPILDLTDEILRSLGPEKAKLLDQATAQFRSILEDVVEVVVL